jgi:ubiquinol-cytochrome c reductase cytochrome b subunit
LKFARSNNLVGIVNSYIIDSPTSANITYLYNIGSMLGIVLLLQIISGITLAFYYTGNISEAFNSIEHIHRDIWYGAIIRYMHSNGAGLLFILLYIHIGKGIYYGSYYGPRIGLWYAGIFIFIIMMATAFLGYTLPFGSMSYWGSTVITSLFSALPYLGDSIVRYIWGGYSITNGTLTRFYALHFVLPFILVASVIIHIIYLHRSGSNNPLGITSNPDKLPFHPYFIFKDIIGFIVVLILNIYIILYEPHQLGHSDNYIAADPLVTPASIVPEFYFLAYYAILRAIPYKLLGVVAMLTGILAPLLLPYNCYYNYWYRNYCNY